MHRCRSQQAHTGGWSIPAALTTALLSVVVTALALPALWPASSLAEVASCCQPDPAMAARLPPHPSRRRQPQPSPAWRLRLSATLLALPTAQEAAALAAGHAAVGAEGALPAERSALLPGLPGGPAQRHWDARCKWQCAMGGQGERQAEAHAR